MTVMSRVEVDKRIWRQFRALALTSGVPTSRLLGSLIADYVQLGLIDNELDDIWRRGRAGAHHAPESSLEGIH